MKIRGKSVEKLERYCERYLTERKTHHKFGHITGYLKSLEKKEKAK